MNLETSNELQIRSQAPFNAEAPLSVLQVVPTPTPLFYVRCNFDVPQIDPADWRLRVDGAVARPRELTFQDLHQYESKESLVLLECAGNGRKHMRPTPSGVAWDLGAVGTARFRGVRLADVLADSGCDRSAVEVVFTGADSGAVAPGRVINFERSLPLSVALDENVLLATHMNDAPLTPEHGFPVRLLVPSWYGVASVKWLVAIHVSETAFTGHFQRERYVYLQDPHVPDGTPVRDMRVRALITSPAHSARVEAGEREIRGIAWSGRAGIAAVDVSCDDGASWLQAAVDSPATVAAPSTWRIAWKALPGKHRILARATDKLGNTQPLDSIYNQLGYGNNAAHAIEVCVE